MTTRVRWMFCVVALGIPGSASAQAVAHSFEDLQLALTRGQTVVITDDVGKRTKGEVVSVSGSALEILHNPPYGFGVPERQVFSPVAVTEVRVADSLRNGFGIGALVGLGTGLALVAASYSGDGGDVTTGQYSFVFGLLGGAGGGLMGALVDASLRAVVYDSPLPRRSVSVTPLLGQDRQGVLASLRF